VSEPYDSNLDPDTFVSVGSGTPIGYPNAKFEATESDSTALAPVDRGRSGNLLVIKWQPDAPSGWNDFD
jgi:hypothetical protein